MKSRQFLELISFQFITVTVDMLDQYSIVDCDSIFEKCSSFHWNGSVISYSLFCINYREFSRFGLYLVDVDHDLNCSQY